MSSEVRPISNKQLAERYKAHARACNWDLAQMCAQRIEKDASTPAEKAEAVYARGYAYEHLGNTDRARECYELAVRLNGHAKAQRRLAALRQPRPK